MARQVKHGTLVASTKTVVTLTTKWSYVQVDNRGSGDIFFTTSGTDPAINGDDCYIVPANSTRTVANARDESICEIELISSGTPAFTVTGQSQPLAY